MWEMWGDVGKGEHTPTQEWKCRTRSEILSLHLTQRLELAFRALRTGIGIDLDVRIASPFLSAGRSPLADNSESSIVT